MNDFDDLKPTAAVQGVKEVIDAEILAEIAAASKPLPNHGGLSGLARDLNRIGGHLSFNGQPVRPEQRIHHRTARLRNGVGAPSTGKPAKPDPAKRALREQRDQLGLSPRQQRKAIKAARRAASTGA